MAWRNSTRISPRRGPGPGFDSRDEAEFAARAELAEILARGEHHQCPRLVHAARAAQYCSKACSNAAFALRKGRAEPRYFDEYTAALFLPHTDLTLFPSAQV